jgi:hypothetical protein
MDTARTRICLTWNAIVAAQLLCGAISILPPQVNLRPPLIGLSSNVPPAEASWRGNSSPVLPGMTEDCIHRTNGHQIVTLDPPTCVEDENHQTFTFRIEVRMLRDVRLPIGGCLIRCFALLHGVGCRTFSK